MQTRETMSGMDASFGPGYYYLVLSPEGVNVTSEGNPDLGVKNATLEVFTSDSYDPGSVRLSGVVPCNARVGEALRWSTYMFTENGYPDVNFDDGDDVTDAMLQELLNALIAARNDIPNTGDDEDAADTAT